MMKNRIRAAMISAAMMASPLAVATGSGDFDSKLYQSCSQRSLAVITAAMVNAKGQSTDAFVAQYKGNPLDNRLATMARNALVYDFRDADPDRLLLLQNFLSGVCYQVTSS